MKVSRSSQWPGTHPAKANVISSLKTEVLCSGQAPRHEGLGNSQFHCRSYTAKEKPMRNACLSWIVLCALASMLGCRGPSPDWNGTWKLNPSKSNFQGPVFSILISADGEYHYDDGRSSFTFRCDGKDRPIGKNRTRACVKSSATVLDLTLKENGIKAKANHWELSAGGTVLTVTATAFPQSGPDITGQLVFSRISGSNDFAGQWRDTNTLQRHADMTIRLDNQALHIDYPSAGQQIDAPLDGVDAAVRGLHSPEGRTYSARSVGRREIRTLTKANGKVLTQGSLELSNDGRVITESWWNPGRPTDKGTLVYERK
jgi:hypothetical protein